MKSESTSSPGDSSDLYAFEPSLDSEGAHTALLIQRPLFSFETKSKGKLVRQENFKINETNDVIEQ